MTRLGLARRIRNLEELYVRPEQHIQVIVQFVEPTGEITRRLVIETGREPVWTSMRGDDA